MMIELETYVAGTVETLGLDDSLRVDALEMAVSGISMMNCVSPNGCVAPGGPEKQYSCDDLGRCVME